MATLSVDEAIQELNRRGKIDKHPDWFIAMFGTGGYMNQPRPVYCLCNVHIYIYIYTRYMSLDNDIHYLHHTYIYIYKV